MDTARSPFNQVLKKKGNTSGQEKQLFLAIWEEREHICELCGASLPEPPVAQFFSHIKPKSVYPELRLAPDNIRLLCLHCHHLADHQSKKIKYET